MWDAKRSRRSAKPLTGCWTVDYPKKRRRNWRASYLKGIGRMTTLSPRQKRRRWASTSVQTCHRIFWICFHSILNRRGPSLAESNTYQDRASRGRKVTITAAGSLVIETLQRRHFAYRNDKTAADRKLSEEWRGPL